MMTGLSLAGIVVMMLLGPRLLGVGRRDRPEVHGHLRVLWWLNRAYCLLVHRLWLDRLAPLPAHGPAILISNHTCGVDNFLLQAGSDRVLGFLIAQEWYDFWLSRPFCRLLGCIPVRRDGRDVAAARAAVRAIRAGRVVVIFPEGKITPQSGAVLGPGRPGAAFLALQTGVPVIPAFVCGTPRTNKIWPSISTPSHARVVFGAPLDLGLHDGHDEGRARERLGDITERMMEAIAALQAATLRREAPPSALEAPAQMDA